MARSDARFSTYSGAPSLQPSLTDSSSHRSSSHPYSSRFSERTSSSQRTIPEKYSGSTTSSASPIIPGSGPVSGMYTNGDAATAGSDWTLASTDSRTADLRSFAQVFDKMTDSRLESQRYVMSGNKTEEFGKIALGAKLDRALSRRMVGQDATFSNPRRPQQSAPSQPQTAKKTPTVTAIDEKRALEVQAA